MSAFGYDFKTGLGLGLGLGLARTSPAYRLATFGDSRVGNTTFASGSSLASNRNVGPVIALAQDLVFYFGGGVSGDQTSNAMSGTRGATQNPMWGAAAGTLKQSISALIACQPDICIIQYGTNDLAAGASAATVGANLIALIDAIVAGGVKVVFESIEPRNDVDADYVTGGAGTGTGYGASPAAKAQACAEANRLVRDHIEASVPTARYVNTHDAMLDPARILGITGVGDPYGYPLAAYMADGTHLRAAGVLAIAPLIVAGIRSLLPRRSAPIPYIGSGPALLKQNFGNFVTGVGEQVVISSGSGTISRANSQSAMDDGSPAQQVIATVTALSGGAAVFQVYIQPPIVGATPTIPVIAGDQIVAAVRFTVDDGSGGTPTGYVGVAMRQRYYHSDASNIYASAMEPTIADLTPLSSLTSGPLDLRPVTAPLVMTKNSANMISSGNYPALSLFFQVAATGTYRFKIAQPSLQVIQRA